MNLNKYLKKPLKTYHFVKISTLLRNLTGLAIQNSSCIKEINLFNQLWTISNKYNRISIDI